jgi:putative flippase GtrA
MQFSRFSLVGASAALAYVVIATGLLNAFGLAPWWASTLSFFTCVPLAYAAQRRIAFRSRRAHTSAFPRYLATQVANMIVAAVSSEALSRLGFLPVTFVFVAAGGFAVLVSYFLLSRWAFSTP